MLTGIRYSLLVLGVISLLQACGPIYQTKYTFVPPERAEGKTCVFQCDNQKLQCGQIAELKLGRCEDRAERDYDRCELRGEKYCYRSSCSSDGDYRRCDQSYRQCFQSCGGKVLSEKVCVSFCDQAPQAG